MSRTLSVIILLLAHICGSAEPHIMRLGTESGLSNNYVMGITQDKNGFVWVATESGLNRFDGSSFKSFKAAENGLAANELNRIVADTVSNLLWICTQRQGLNMLDCDTYRFIGYIDHSSDEKRVQGLSSVGITDVAVTPEGNLWVTNYDSGLDFIDRKSGKISHFNRSNVKGLTDDHFWTVCNGPDGILYLGHVNGGFSVLDPVKMTARNYRNIPGDDSSLPGNAVRAIHIDSHNNIWAGTNRGLALFNRHTGRFSTFRHHPGKRESLVSDNIYHLTQTSSDELWISTENGGVSILDLRQSFSHSPAVVKFRNITTEPDDSLYLSNKTIHAVFEDSYGNIWIGTYGDGIDIMCRRDLPLTRLHKNRHRNPLSDNAVMSVCLASDTLFVGTDERGADIFIKGDYAGNINSANSPLEDNAVIAMLHASDGKIWLGTYEGSVVSRDVNGRLEAFRIPEAYDVRCFAEKPDGTILVGLGKGIAEIAPDGKITTRYASEGRLHEEWVRSIAVTPWGEIWAGSFGNGISIYDHDFKFIRRLEVNRGLTSNTIHQLLVGPDGKVRAATGNGLAIINAEGKVERIYGMADGLSDPVVKALCHDATGTLWMTTGSGISALDNTGKISNYGQGQGITTTDFNRASVAVAPSGEVYFGSHDGLYRLNPKLLTSRMSLHVPAVTGVTVFGQQGKEDDREIFVLSGKLELDHDENTLKVDFGILDASDASAVVWSYNVEGIDDRWYPASPENGILLRDLAPGKYRLVIKASVPNQTEEVTTVLPFRINPPIWATIWAKLLYAAAIIASILFGLNFWRKRLDLEYTLEVERKNNIHQNELNAERLRFFTNITHELRTPLTLILGPLEDMKSDPDLSPAQSRKIGIIHKSASRLLELINTILEFRKTETQNKRLKVAKADISILVSEIGSRYSELNTNPAIEIATDIELGDYTLWFDTETVSIIIDNLMSNACKYTVQGNVTLKLRHTSESGVPFTEISVSDTGLGMDSATLLRIFDRYYRDNNSANRLGTGIGLALVYNLVQLHKGEIFVESEPGKGSVFRFRIQTDNTYPEAQRESSIPADSPSDEITTGNPDQPDEKPLVLVVDDNIDILSYIKGVLTDSYRVETATDGEEGLAKAQSLSPDIILSDVMMPKMDGMDMIKRLKESADTSHIPVIVVTAKIAEDARLEAYRLGADSFITKPFSSKLLVARLSNILQTRHQLAAQALGRQTLPATPAQNRPETVSVSSPETVPETDTPIISRLTEADEEFVKRIGEIIEHEISGENLDVEFIADEMCMSHSTLYRKVKAITGRSVARLIRKYRARKAADLMLTGRYTISEIALMVGMGSPGNFRQCFREEFNTTPSEYLKSAKQKPAMDDAFVTPSTHTACRDRHTED